MNLLERWAKQKVAEEPPIKLELGVKTQVNIRLYQVYAEALDAIADRLHMPRTTAAAEMMELAITQVGRTIGVEVIPNMDTGEYEVALFNEGRSDEDEASA